MLFVLITEVTGNQPRPRKKQFSVLIVRKKLQRRVDYGCVGSGEWRPNGNDACLAHNAASLL